jgi:hypothetical protein
MDPESPSRTRYEWRALPSIITPSLGESTGFATFQVPATRSRKRQALRRKVVRLLVGVNGEDLDYLLGWSIAHQTCALRAKNQPSCQASAASFPLFLSKLKKIGSGEGSRSLRLSNEHCFIVRVPRARKTPHCPLFSQSLLRFPYFVFRSLPEPDEIILVLDPDKPADDQGKNEKFLPLFVHDRHDRKAPEGCQRAAG